MGSSETLIMLFQGPTLGDAACIWITRYDGYTMPKRFIRCDIVTSPEYHCCIYFCSSSSTAEDCLYFLFLYHLFFLLTLFKFILFLFSIYPLPLHCAIKHFKWEYFSDFCRCEKARCKYRFHIIILQAIQCE